VSTIPQGQDAEHARDESEDRPAADEEAEEGNRSVGERLKRAQGRSTPAYGFRLIRYAVGAVTAIFVSVLVYALLAEPDVFGSATQLIAAMSAAFTIIGSMVAAYFGIKAGLDGQDKLNDARDREREQMRRDRKAERSGSEHNGQHDPRRKGGQDEQQG
jgi:uncharacterized protein YacL